MESLPLKSKMGVAYSSDLKKMCVEAVLPGHGSVDDIVEKYSIDCQLCMCLDNF